MNDKIYKNMDKHSKNLSKYACEDTSAVYLKPYNEDIRTPFFKDIDKILYSLSFVRYMDKTQVFTNRGNDHLQKRMLHVQYVSKIARTIGRALNLNEDLIEAAALGHDLGHTPYGHRGEKILNEISLEWNEGYFMHNINSVRNLLYIENFGNGQNVSLQVLDAIMCHNGEIVSNEIHPKNKNINDFFEEYNGSYKSLDIAKYLRPMTLEGCVVRISDIIAYIGRDIEDGVRLGIISWNDVPKEITDILGKSNNEIVNTIVSDIIIESFNKNYIKMSDEVYNALSKLKDFNYKYIYSKAYTDREMIEFKDKFKKLANRYLNDLETGNKESSIYKSYLSCMSDEYKKCSNKRIVIDYISGMTDDYFNEECK